MDLVKLTMLVKELINFHYGPIILKIKLKK